MIKTLAALVAALVLVGATNFYTRHAESGPAPEVLTIKGPPDTSLTLQCFSTRQDNSQQRAALVTTQSFGLDQVRLTRSALLCQSARLLYQRDGQVIQRSHRSLTHPQTAQCYQLEQGATPARQPVLWQSADFGVDAITLGPAEMLCQQAQTAHSLPGDGPPIDQTSHPSGSLSLLCYEVRDAGSPATPAILETPFYGKDAVTIGYLTLLCETSGVNWVDESKNGGRPTGQVWGCYQLEQGAAPNTRAVLDFADLGMELVMVGQASLMCRQGQIRPTESP
jgi:hypothetical protein